MESAVVEQPIPAETIQESPKKKEQHDKKQKPKDKQKGKKKEGKQNSSSDEEEPKKRSRTIEDVMKRMKWDEALDRTQCLIGYEDRFIGILEVPFDNFDRDTTSETFIPLHRIIYFRYKGRVVWDRRDKTDEIFK